MDRFITVQEHLDLKNWIVDHFATKSDLNGLRNDMLTGFDYTYGKLDALTQELTAQGHGMKRLEATQEQDHAAILRFEATQEQYHAAILRLEKGQGRLEKEMRQDRTAIHRLEATQKQDHAAILRLLQGQGRLEKEMRQDRTAHRRAFQKIESQLAKLTGALTRTKRKQSA